MQRILAVSDKRFLISHESYTSVFAGSRVDGRFEFILFSFTEREYLLKTFSLSQIGEEIDKKSVPIFCGSTKLVVVPFLLTCFKLKKMTRTYSAYIRLWTSKRVFDFSLARTPIRDQRLYLFSDSLQLITRCIF